MRHRRRWLGLAAVLLTVAGGGLGWQALRPPAPGGPPAPGAQASAAAPATLATRAATASAVAAVASAATRPAERGVGAEAVQESVEVCGVGRVTRQQVESGSASELAGLKAKADALEQRQAAARSQLSARLAVGSDVDRVAARLLMDDADGAAHIAARSGDAAAYRLALRACGSRQTTPASAGCRALSVQGWLQRDPQDARAWTAQMAEAWQRKDEAAATQALEQMLQREPRNIGSPLLEAMVKVQDALTDPEARGLLAVEIIGRDAALPLADLFALTRYCSAERVKEAVQHARCERLARWQLAHAHDLMDALTATALADRVGLPDRQRPFTGEQLRRGERLLLEQSMTMLALDCASLRRIGAWAAERVQQGELKQVLQAGMAE